MKVYTFDKLRNTYSNSGSSHASLNSGFYTVNVDVSEVQHGTSAAVGGLFALSFNQHRTMYMQFDVDERTLKDELDKLPSIGAVDVSRSNSDENGGYTWSVTFLSNLGPQSFLVFDNLDMTGTVVTGVVMKSQIGIAPPFDSISGLPFGTSTLTDLSNLQLVVHNLEQNIPYYFRVCAINTIGQGPFALSNIPFIVPFSQRPDPPVNPTLSVVDGSTLSLNFESPQNNGGQPVSFYRVEYSTKAFLPEIQQITEMCPVTKAVQILSTSTSHNIPEKQLLYFSTSFTQITQTEIQQVVCDANGGNFRLNFNGQLTASIPFNAGLTQITNALQQLESINSVSVSWTYTFQTQACNSRATNPGAGFLVTFTNVVNKNGNLPLMTATTNSLLGLRYIKVTRVKLGSANLGGSIRLAFRGATTRDINVDITQGTSKVAQNIQTELSLLDSIPTGGVTVTYEATPSAPFSYLFRVTFTDPNLQGNIESLQNIEYFNQLTGSDVSLSIFTDGVETLQQRGGAPNPSVAGNQLGGNFTLTYRGHKTTLLDFNADEESVKGALEALPNIGTVDVNRFGPSIYQEYSWTVTFLSMPGAYPQGSESVSLLQINYLPSNRPLQGLTGVSSTASVSSSISGSSPLGGSFSLSMLTSSVGSLTS